MFKVIELDRAIAEGGTATEMRWIAAWHDSRSSGLLEGKAHENLDYRISRHRKVSKALQRLARQIDERNASGAGA